MKLHRSYTVEEAADTLAIHKNTVRAWLKTGLPSVDQQRPTLILGAHLREFLKARRAKRRRPCPPGHIYCVRCRAPKQPAEGMVDFVALSAGFGNLRGICPDCETLMHRRVNRAKLATLLADSGGFFAMDQEHIRETTAPSENCDSETEV